MNRKKTFAVGFASYFEKQAMFESMFAQPMIGAGIGAISGNEGKQTRAAGIGTMAGAAGAIGAEAGEKIADMIGIENKTLPQTIGAIAGLTAFKSMYDIAYPRGSGLFDTSGLIGKLEGQLNSAKNIAGKAVDAIPFGSDLRGAWEKSLQPSIVDIIKKIGGSGNE